MDTGRYRYRPVSGCCLWLGCWGLALMLLGAVPVQAGGLSVDPRQPLRSGQVYRWEQRMQLLHLGARRKADAIPCPCLWDARPAHEVLQFRGRRWSCAEQDASGHCQAVRLLGAPAP